MGKTARQLTLSLLGTPKAEVDGNAIEVDTRKAIALLAYLAVTGERQPRDSLAYLLWPDYDHQRSRAALRRTLSTLKTALGGEWIHADRKTVTLDRERLSVDVDEFRRCLDECATHGHSSSESCPLCLKPLSNAAALYRDEFLAGFGVRDSVPFDDWQLFQSAELRRDVTTALDRLADGLSAQGNYEQAISHTRRRLALDPLHEPAHRRLMQLYALSGQRSSALSQYRECVRMLDHELGVAPLDETSLLYRAIREGSEGPEEPQLVSAPVDSRPRPHPLVGRKVEWRAFLETYEAVGPDGRFLGIEGEAGIGKTRLGNEFVGWAKDQGAVGVEIRCFEGEDALAYGPIIELLRGVLREGDPSRVEERSLAEVSRLLPELGQPPMSLLDGLAAQAHFHEAIASVLAAAASSQPPAVFFIDDIHWADEASLRTLSYTLRRLDGSAMLISASWRAEEIAAGSSLQRLLADVVAAGAGQVVSLGRLDLSDVSELVEDAGASAEVATRIYEETEGIPLFVVEYLEALMDADDADETDLPLPSRVRDLLRARLSTLGGVAEQVLAAGAAVGRSFDFETVRDSSGRTDEETVEALEELSKRGVIREQEDGDYDFRHEQTRAVVYEGTSLARRRLLHGRIADALALSAHREEAASAIAEHLRRAGRDEEAAAYFMLAGGHARRLYANDEALLHFKAALGLGHPDAAAIHEEIGDLQTLDGDYAGALASYEAAAAISGRERLATIEHKLGAVHQRRGEWHVALDHYRAADEAMVDGADAQRARLEADRSLSAHRLGSAEEAQAHAAKALALAKRAGDRQSLAQAHNILGILATSRGDHAAAREHLEQSLMLAEALGEPTAQIAALNNLALAHRADGELERAIELTEAAIAACAQEGDRHHEAALRNNLADFLRAAGRDDKAMEELKEAVAIFADIGEEGTMEPEIWKLVEW